MTAAAATVAAEAMHPPTAKTLNELLQLPAQMALSQIELIYRAEGNANLVLALPQFKKVLRLPKMISNSQSQSESQSQDRPEKQPNVSEPTKAGVLTMPDFMAYMEIMRRLLGNEFVCEPDIVAIPKESDRFWINEHIRDQRPIARLDKEFVGPFGLMLPDVTQLPATFDVLLANLQAKDMNTDMNADICNDSEFDGSSSSSCRTPQGGKSGEGAGECSGDAGGGITRLGDTYAIEIKPKQGWMQLASDVSDLFDLMPAGAEETAETTMDMETTSNLDASCNPSNLLRRGQQGLTLTPDKCRCRYCSMQLLKLHTGKIKQLGDYCPLELFSGEPGRMVNALNALFACPQNNLRVFQRGNLIYGDHANSISCDELHTRIFPGEIMALIKHLLVACLLREYNKKEEQKEAKKAKEEKDEAETEAESRGQIHVAAFGCGMKTKATEATEIAASNVDAGEKEKEKGEKEKGEREAGIVVEFVKAVAGQPQRRSTTTAEKATQRCTKRCRISATTTSTTATTTTTSDATKTTTCCESTSSLSTNANVNVNAAMPTATAARTETEMATLTTMATPTLSPSPFLSPSPSLSLTATRAQINKAEIFHLPKNCVLQKILHLQLLVKRHFHYMWQTGQAKHATPTYAALRGLLSSCQRNPAVILSLDSDSDSVADNADQLAAEQAYMLGATALDCSIMLTFQQIRCHSEHNSSLQPWLVTLQGRQFLTKLTVLDLDPKPDSHFHKSVKQMRQIEKCCRALN